MANTTDTTPRAGRRFGLSLGTRIFLITSLLIVFSLGTAVLVTAYLGSRIGRQAISKALAGSASAQASFQQQYYERLELLSRLFTSDPALTAYLAEAAESRDSRSILDLLSDRQRELGFDFAIVLDPSGRMVTRTDQPQAAAEDLSKRSLVAAALEKGSSTGVWQEGGELYFAVAVPLQRAFDLYGFLVTGFKVNDVLALDVKRTSGTEVAFLSLAPEGARVVATTLSGALAQDLAAHLAPQGRLLSDEEVEVPLGGRSWIALPRPLRDAGDKTVGATVALAPVDEALATYRQIVWVLIIVGLVAMLIAFALSYALSRRTLGPVRRLLKAAEAARQGDYDQKIEVERADEVGQLARAFAELLSDLREKRDMETYVAELARNLPEPSLAPARAASEVHPSTLVAIELRRFANARAGSDPQETIDRLSRDLRRIATAVHSRQGRVEAVLGHRVLASFDGEGRSFRALSAATESLAAAAIRESAFDEMVPPAVAVVSGEVVSGSVVWGDQPSPALVGLTVQKLESLLREATPGDLAVAPEVYQELSSTFQQAGLELAPQRGMLSSQTLYLLSAEIAARVTGVEPPSRSIRAELPSTGAQTLSEINPGALLAERFEILSVLGSGGMGVVYKARDRELGDLVALKMLKREVWGEAAQLDRLKTELRLARKITHPNVLRTYDFGEFNGIPFISMEYVRGVTLRYLLDQTDRLPFSAGLRLSKQLCSGLAAAHAVGVLHRDIKPENLIIEHTGNAKLMDFGIARPIRREGPGQTQAGWIVGTPQYLSPEQLEGREADTRADIYSCGVVLYELFTGALPFSGETPMQVIMKHLNEAPAPPSTLWSAIPPALEHAILTCLEKEPGKRYRSVEELHRELERLSA